MADELPNLLYTKVYVDGKEFSGTTRVWFDTGDVSRGGRSLHVTDPHTPTDENDPDEDGDVSPDVRNDPVPDDPAPKPDEEGEEQE